MSDTTKTQLELELVRLAKRIEELVVTVEHLKEENRALRQLHESLSTERGSLLHKNEQVRTRVEAMIGRLKRSEEHTSELQSPDHLVCRLLLEKKKQKNFTREMTGNDIVSLVGCS